MRRIVSAALSLLALAGAAGCTQAPGSDRAGLVNGLASRIDQATTKTYTATYRLTDGSTATIAQATRPAKSAVTGPDGVVLTTSTKSWVWTSYTSTTGRIIITPDRTVTCRAGACVTSEPPSALPGAATGPGFVPPTAVIRLLSDAALREGTIAQHDDTVAGQHAQCVTIGGTEGCVTDEGVLASFTGTADGAEARIQLTGYTDSAADQAFGP